jgi:hypothetical protein
MPADAQGPPGPVAWPEVVAQYGPEYENNVDVFNSLPDQLGRLAPPRYAGGRLGGIADTAAALAVLRGPAAARPLIEHVAGSIPHVVAQLAPDLPEAGRLAAAYTLAYLNAARCCGVPIGSESSSLEHQWLPQLAALRAKLTEEERHTLAFAAAAAGLPQVAAELAAQRLEHFSPNVTHGFDVPAFAGYLAAAVEAGASYDDVENAWLDFVHRFPYKLDTGMLKWPALLWAARAIYATIGRLPDDEVATELHSLVAGA